MFTEKTTSAGLVTPEIEVTILYYSILRIRWLLESATYRFVPSVVIPVGLLKLADVPVPFAEPEDPVPASVVTAPEVVVLSVVVELLDVLLFLAQEMKVRLKRDMRIMYKTLFIFSSIPKVKYYLYILLD